MGASQFCTVSGIKKDLARLASCNLASQLSPYKQQSVSFQLPLPRPAHDLPHWGSVCPVDSPSKNPGVAVGWSEGLGVNVQFSNNEMNRQSHRGR
jgi:hypothetical protein